MLLKEPDQRLSLIDIFKHPWLNNHHEHYDNHDSTSSQHSSERKTRDPESSNNLGQPVSDDVVDV